MSRELKFRAWSNEHNRYCDFVTLDELGRWIGWIESNGVFLTTTDIVIEQDTGLKDKNGKEIYEGDIVKVDSEVLRIPFEHKTEASPVYYDNRETAFVYHTAFGGIAVGRHDTSVEVIGNIHENRELLGGK